MVSASPAHPAITEEVLAKCLIGTDATEMEQFMATYRFLADTLCAELSFASPDAQAWFKRNLDYNVPGGKLNRGISVRHAFSALINDREATNEEVFQCYVLGWAVEFLQAFFLVADDLMDASITRRGQPCWYKVEEVKMIAINDSIMLEGCIYRMLKTYFKGNPTYLPLVELFLDNSWYTEIGQLHDLITAPEDNVDLTRFSLDKYKLIVKYKTAYYSFYLPVAEAMILAGVDSEKQLAEAEKILLCMGEYFQIQDDYLDCYGSPEVIGKIGTDIQDNKCSWLVVQALDRVTPEQRQILEDNYGQKEAINVEKVKALYLELELEAVFKKYEEESYSTLMKMINSDSHGIPTKVFTDFVAKIYKRSK
ncbi:farnesyl pyrophosphate synthase [Sphaeroforma arctica JP610]|uniref:Farnesyl pyrophosphate synthase n=1 Tax=Sphaeroforma arctica JP610 TaxID=667725 RepID=A0A0L0G965_9EUKA|nr:farnesyl pyrophosphate synthase [Sphaeroforma arctica JP610]KNC84793.1 farnesyl pyrophosphate synthase [Sphaeroforma arctica JP610]|eukprot:XP_014158695.1 farnesyl pyrophosphate synthase [Sphaeroforma arctica JP610]